MLTAVHYARGTRELKLSFDDGLSGALSAEFLRVHSPSAEVRGHGGDDAVLQTGKAKVAITAIEGVGHYALQLAFDDGHNTGIYSYDYLRTLLEDREGLWQAYLDKLASAGASRDPDTQVLHFEP